jgi:hypothetical protein
MYGGRESWQQLLLPGALNSGSGGPWRCVVYRGCRATTPIDGYDRVVGDLALADRALTVVGVNMEPLIEALPAEEMAALGDDGFGSHVKADVALKVGSTAGSLVIGLPGAGRSRGSGGG